VSDGSSCSSSGSDSPLDPLNGPDSPCAGRAYFISNGEPVRLWSWLNALLAQLGLPQVRRAVGYRTAYAFGAVSEAVWRSLCVPGEPPITRFLASALARSHWYDMRPATDAFGYHVRVPMAEATKRTVMWLANGGGLHAARGRQKARRYAFRQEFFVRPSCFRCLFTVRAAISLARSFDFPWRVSLSLTCSYCLSSFLLHDFGMIKHLLLQYWITAKKVRVMPAPAGRAHFVSTS
jgi:hypothetical protein